MNYPEIIRAKRLCGNNTLLTSTAAVLLERKREGKGTVSQAKDFISQTWWWWCWRGNQVTVSLTADRSSRKNFRLYPSLRCFHQNDAELIRERLTLQPENELLNATWEFEDQEMQRSHSPDLSLNTATFQLLKDAQTNSQTTKTNIDYKHGCDVQAAQFPIKNNKKKAFGLCCNMIVRSQKELLRKWHFSSSFY